MVHSSFGKYRLLIHHVSNWPTYFVKKWFAKKGDARFQLRKSGANLRVPMALLSVFKEIFMCDGYETVFIEQQLPKGAVVVDVGANIGLFAAYVATIQPDVHIHAFEPLPQNLAMLRQNANASPAFSKSIAVVPAALTGTDVDAITFYHNTAEVHSQSASTVSGFLNNHTAITVAATSLASYVAQQNISIIHLLKLDCEGAEYDILYKSPPSVLAMVQAIVVETHDLGGAEQNVASVRAFLGEIGFTCTKAHDVGNGLNLTWAVRTTQ